MAPLKTKFNSTPSNRILQLAQHKESKATWVTTPGRKLTWGNQEPMWPVSVAALKAVPTPRVQVLAQHKKDLFAFHQELLSRKEEEDRRVRKISYPLSRKAQYEHIVRLATPRSGSSQDVSCSVWHISSSARNAGISPRLLQLAHPKSTHPNFRSNRQTVETNITYAAKTAQPSPRVEQLCLPKIRESRLFLQRGPPESPV